MDRLKTLAMTGLGTGYLPIAPGTWGSAVVVALYLLLGQIDCECSYAVDAGMVLVVVVSSIICVALGPFAERHFGKKDPGQVTIDEWAGQAVALIALPAVGVGGALTAAGVAFVAFRVFDIIKPPPARQLERLPAGWGMLCDDLAAGVYANIVSQVLLRVMFT